MFDSIKKKMKKRKDKKNTKPGKLKQILVNNEPIKALNIQVFSEKEDAFLRIITTEETASLHFEELDFLIESDTKRVKIKGEFKDAQLEKKFYVYTFIIADYHEFFV